MLVECWNLFVWLLKFFRILSGLFKLKRNCVCGWRLIHVPVAADSVLLLKRLLKLDSDLLLDL